MIGRALGHYRVTAALGAGGMGEVYRATDTRLGREVALKVLPAEMAANPERLERFRREARALAALDHPGIVTVYSVEEHEGVHFITMQLVEGQPLDRVIAGHGLPAARIRDIALALAEALGVAHDRGVVHRDLKPANVMLASDGRVKVLDFGLAKIGPVEPSSDSQFPTGVPSGEGLVMGTVPYMSPEQVQGRSVDHRSDLFSLGVMLYEMATGRRPFAADSSAGVMSAILRDTPPPVTSIRGDLPAELQRAIARCLHKDPAHRPQRARDLFAASDVAPTPGADSGPARAPFVLVLPFVSRSPDPGDGYFADGLTEEVITDLAGIEALRVISRNSAMALKGTSRDTASLARELGVTHVVSGSVRIAGPALRVTVELLAAGGDVPLWAEKYSGTLADVFGIQEEIARKIVAALKVKLTDSERREAAKRPIDNVVAWDGYLRARQEMYQWTPESSRRAQRLVDEALAIVGEVPLLLATKGQLHWNEVNSNLTSAETGLAAAEGFVARALALDPDLPLAIYVRGLVAGARGQPEAALPDLYRAHELAPGDANILCELCRFSNVAGLQHHGALVDRTVELDPLAFIPPLVVSTYSWVNGLWERAAVAGRRSVELAPGPSMLHVIAAWQIAAAGYRDEAAGLLREAARALAGSPVGSWARFLERALAADNDGALHQARAIEGALGNEIAARMTADAFALLGHREDALRWLRAAIRMGFVNHPSLTEHAPFLARLRDDPEYRALTESVRPRWQALVEWERLNTPGGRAAAR